ncbi:MAG: carcinine hydrolase/isopenicillin-N N-acyltransferase family protein [Nocardioidaceae bacterium]
MCDTFVSLTDDGVLLAKNSDRDPNEAQTLHWSPAADHAPGAVVDATWSVIDQAPHTHAVVLSRPWWMWGAEMGANEHGLVIGNEAVFTRRTGRSPRTGTELLGMDLLRLALERAADRHEAVEVLVGLLERHGQGGSCSHEHPRFTYDSSFLLADPAGAVVLETAGRRWAAEEVRGPGRAISNGLTIPAFAERFADPLRGRVARCAVRRERTTAVAGRARDVADMIAGLRDHGSADGAADVPRWSAVNGALGAPCAHAGGLVTSTQSTASWVADLRGPQVHWVTGTSAPCTSLFRPVAVDRPLPEDRVGNHFDDGSAWWRHELVHRVALRDHPAALELFRDERDAVEREWLADPPEPGLAQAESERLDRWWAGLVAGADLADTRPAWLRRLWSRWDRAAGLPVV